MYNLTLTDKDILRLAKRIHPKYYRSQRIDDKRPKVCNDILYIGVLKFNYDALSLTYNMYCQGEALHLYKILFTYILHILWKTETMPEGFVRQYAQKHYMDFSEVTHFTIA